MPTDTKTSDRSLAGWSDIIERSARQARALASQRSFEAMFDRRPQVDTRTPADVAAQAAREGWK